MLHILAQFWPILILLIWNFGLIINSNIAQIYFWQKPSENAFSDEFFLDQRCAPI